MPKQPKRSARDEALYAHWHQEAQEFGLKPWQTPPCQVTDHEPDPEWSVEHKDDWNHARALRRAILAANPGHYDDMQPRRRSKK